MAPADVLSLERAREAYFTHDTVPHPDVVRPVIFESWRRTRLHGLDPSAADPSPAEHHHAEGQLLEAARAVMEQQKDVLDDLACAVILTDLDGCILQGWVQSPRLAEKLESRHLVPGYRVAEQTVGTGGSTIALETGKSVMVVGAEHFAEFAKGMGTASTAIRHPLTKQVIGTLGLTCRAERISPFMLRWVENQALGVQQHVLAQASGSERLLLERFLAADRNSKQPVLCVSERMVISNVAATRVMPDLDQAVLWELAAGAARSGRGAVELTLPLSDGTVNVTCEPVSTGGAPVGALLRLAEDRVPRAPRSTRSAAVDPRRVVGRLVGRSPAWMGFCRELHGAVESGEPLLIVGEPGVGKTAVVTELVAGCEQASIVDARKLLERGANWESVLEPVDAPDTEAVVLENLDAAGRADVTALTAAYGDLVDPPRLIATATIPGFDPEAATSMDVVSEWPGRVVTLPPLRERAGDLPDLLEALMLRRTGSQNRQLWASAAVQLVGRVAWPHNVASLAALVARVHAVNRGRWVTPENLPSEVRAMASRRALGGLEQLEAHAILHALKSAEGNKKLAAEALGIARSTLYRKVRALGIDLSSAIY